MFSPLTPGCASTFVEQGRNVTLHVLIFFFFFVTVVGFFIVSDTGPGERGLASSRPPLVLRRGAGTSPQAPSQALCGHQVRLFIMMPQFSYFEAFES